MNVLMLPGDFTDGNGNHAKLYTLPLPVYGSLQRACMPACLCHCQGPLKDTPKHAGLCYWSLLLCVKGA